MKEQSLSMGIADAVATFSGSILFLLINLVAFALWILLNTVAPKGAQFDPYPFQFLTMSVSLEAIFLSIFVLISQNRQSEKDRRRAEQDLQVDLQGEAEIREVMARLQDQDMHLMLQDEKLAMIQEMLLQHPRSPRKRKVSHDEPLSD